MTKKQEAPKPKKVKCYVCGGLGVWETDPNITCGNCNGNGWVEE